MSTPITRKYLITHCGYSELQVAAMCDEYVLDLFAREYMHRSAMRLIAPEPASSRFATTLLICLAIVTAGILAVIAIGWVIPKFHN